MRTLRSLSFIMLALICKYSIAQEVVELSFKPLDSSFIKLTNTLVEIDKDDRKSIDLSIDALTNFNDSYIRYNLIFWELSFHYANSKQYDKCFEILKTGQQEGMYYFIRNNNRPFPPFLKEIENYDGYKLFLEQNKRLIDEARTKKGKTEYMIQLPEGYDEKNKYPLLLVMHGGLGNIQQSQYYYNSPKLQQEYITAYFQGGTKEATFDRTFSREHWQNRIKEGFEQIIQKYSVDSNKVILAGPSAGGYRSIILGLNHIIPAQGLLLSFPGIPEDLDSTVYIKSAERGLKVALLTGENDGVIQQQKELGYKLDTYGIPNRFVVFPDIGHEFPKKWAYHLDTSLEYILKED